MRYEYPAIISYDQSGNVYYVDFPDVSGCFTDGKTLHEALDNAEDALKTMLSYMEIQGNTPPTASEVNTLRVGIGEIVALITTETNTSEELAV